MSEEILRPFDTSQIGQRSDFSGVDFRGMNLSGVDFSNCNLEGSDFTGANLNGAHFINANVSIAKFHEADIRGANFTNAQLISNSCEDSYDWIANLPGEFVADAMNDFEAVEAEWEEDLQREVWDHEDSLSGDDDEFDEEEYDDDEVLDENHPDFIRIPEVEMSAEEFDEFLSEPPSLSLSARESTEESLLLRSINQYVFSLGERDFVLGDLLDEFLELQEASEGSPAPVRKFSEDQRLYTFLTSAFSTEYQGPYAADFSDSVWDNTTVWPIGKTIYDYPFTHSPPKLCWSECGLDSIRHYVHPQQASGS